MANTYVHTLGRIRLSVSLFYFITGLTFASWASRIPDIRHALGLSDGALGMVLFAIPAGQLAMMALSGLLVARLGSRKVILFATLGYACVLCGIAASGSVAALAVCLFFFGAMANMLNIAINTQAVFLERQYGRPIMASFHGMWSLGGFAGGVLGTVFAASGLPLGCHYATVLALSAANSLANRRYLVREDRAAAGAGDEKGFRFADIEGLIVLLGVTGFCGMFCEGTVYDWSSVYFSSVVRPSDALIRAGYIAGMAAMTCGRFLADRFVARFGSSAVLRACGGLIVAGLLLATALPRLVPATLGFLLVGAGISSTVPICYSMAGRHSSMKVSTAITLVSSISFIGFLVGPPVIGLVAEMSGLRLSLAMASVFGLAIALLAGVINRRVGAKAKA